MNKTRAALIGILLAIPFIYLWRIYPSLQAIVPTHFGLDGKPNDFGSKAMLPWTLLLLSGVALGVNLLIRYLPMIDPKKSAATSARSLQAIGLAVVALISVISCVLLYSAAHGVFNMQQLLLPVISIFFVIMGNLMYNIKPNYFVGIRVPWTLEHEDNWRATHHMAGRLWVIGGLIITIAALCITGPWGFYLFVGGITVLTLVPILYSFWYFKTRRGSTS